MVFLELHDTYVRTPVKVCGALVLNERLNKVLLVQDWHKKTWGAPRGKQEEGESDLDTALRELREETGFDASTAAQESRMSQADQFCLDVEGHTCVYFVVRNVPESTNFISGRKKEIFAVKFCRFDRIPLRNKILSTVVGRLQRWLKNRGLRVNRTTKVMRSWTANLVPKIVQEKAALVLCLQRSRRRDRCGLYQLLASGLQLPLLLQTLLAATTAAGAVRCLQPAPP